MLNALQEAATRLGARLRTWWRPPPERSAYCRASAAVFAPFLREAVAAAGLATPGECLVLPGRSVRFQGGETAIPGVAGPLANDRVYHPGGVLVVGDVLS